MALTEKQKEIIKKCKADPIFFIENFVYIETEEEGIILFKLFEYQKQLIRDLLNGDINLHLWKKSRQIGASTLLSAFAVWLTNFHMSKSVAIVATDLRVAKKLHAKARYAWSKLPDYMRMKHNNKNMTQLFLKNRSKIEAFPYSKDKGTRSISASLVVMDEAAFMVNADDVWGAIEPSLSKSGNVVALSSPDIPSGWFYEVCTEAKLGDSDWHLVKLSWDVHPDRDEKWRAEKDRRVGKRKAAREYDAEFGISEGAYFDVDYLEKLKEEFETDPIRKERNEALWIWEEPIEGETYLVIVDPAEGAHDLSCIQVIRVSTWTQVAEFLKKIHYEQFNYIVIDIAKRYNKGLLVIEDNSIGKTTISRAKDLGYSNLYWRGKGKEKQILNLKKAKVGWNTNTRTRPLIIESLRQFIETEEGVLAIQSSRSYDQLASFVEKNGKPQANAGAYDDAVMALSIGSFVYGTNTVKLENPVTVDNILEMMSKVNHHAELNYEKMKTEDESEEAREKKQKKDNYDNSMLPYMVSPQQHQLQKEFNWVR